MTDTPSHSAFTASVDRVIAAPAEAIFDLIATPSRHPEFDGSGTVKGTASGPAGKVKLGDRFGMNMHMGFDYQMVNTIIEYDEGRLIAWQTTSEAPIARHLIGGRIWRYELTPVDGGTLVRETWDLSREKGLKILTFNAMRSKTMKNMSSTLDRIATVLGR